MKTKKLKSTKCGSNRRKVPSDVSPTTSLPPLVEGQLRCFLRVTVSRVLWTVPKPSPTTFIRLRWWGESSNGTQFRPRDGSQTTQKTVKSTARFPIRCGPKQFTSYLTDMGSLVLEVLTKPEHLPIARAQVAGISCLSLSHSISGFFTLVSPTSEKLGELQVSLALEALTETYDSSCSVPTTDMSIETAVSAFRSTVKPASQPNILVVPSLSRPLSVNSGKESGSNTPRGKDHFYFQNAQTEKKTDLALENQKPTSIRSQHGQGAANPTVQESTHGQTTNDILSVILERGSKLRNAMVVSALKSDMDSELALKDTPLPLPKDNIGAPPMPSIPPCGRLLQNILHADSSLLQSPHSPPDFLSPDCTAADTENRAVDLLLGSLNGSALPIWDGEGSPPDSFLSVYGDSELNDPQYDQSLLENLFYNAPMSNSGPSDDNKDGPPKKNLKKRGDDEELRHSGPKKSGGLDSEDVQTPGTGDMLPGLCMDQLTVLGEVRLARVVIHSLTVPTDSTTITPKKISGKGKPPRPLSKKCSYFVEYLFPVASSRHDPSQAMAAEVTQVFSSKVTGGMVNFQQRSVFPVHFSGSTIEQWWGTELTFNIYSRKSSQKKPVAIGKAVFPLRFLLQREQLSQTIILPVQSLQGPGESQDIGPLKVSLELAADNKDFSSANGQRSDGAGSRTPSHALTSHQREASPSGVDMTTIRPQHHDTRGEDIPLSTVNSRNSRTGKRTVAPQGPSPLTSLQTSHHRPQAHQVVEEEDSEVLLHALLMVPNGKDFSCGPMQPPNVYLNCKLFGQDETSRSVISWGQTNPSFNFVQVAPVALTSRLLERMRNNVMVIEVWQRAGSSGQDRLLGLVKLPLHQFYMSFRDPKISQLLLQAQYPVLGVDSYMPVIDVFSGIIKGNLRVLLAMGLSVQIVSLQRMRDEELGSVSHLPRPAHLLDHQPKEQNVKPSPEEAMREHLFVVKVERVKGLTPLQSTVWGEADCYVQYTFPTQEEPPAQSLDPNLLEGSVNLRQFRTTTTLCVPDPVFGHSESHVLLAPVGVPVQRLLLSSFSSQGLANGGGIPFEVWCRYYYPNVRDQLVAKGMLPLSKLCAMVTMQRQQPTEAQVFSLPLMPRTDSPAGHQPQPSGLLDVFVHYKQRLLRSDVRSGTVASQVVTMVVQVHRAAGLQAAARALSEQDETFQYYADVGVNVYVTAQLSFLPESERRSTRVAARTFCPEFDHHTEFPCELQVQRSSGETCSLAELLQEATAVFTVWNRDSRKVMVSPRSKNTLLGTVRIQLADLIHKRTGISGWFGVSLTKDLTSSPRHHIFVGGLDISINFAHHADRERVVTAAQVLGWEVGREEEEPPNEGETWAETRRTVSLTVSMPRAWLPVHCLLLPGHSELQRSTYCYFRYKLYDGEAFCSQLRHPGLSVEEEGGGGEEGLSTVAFRGSRTVELRSSQPLLWYLREERLEIQVWVSFGKDRRPRPHDMDRLVGSAFVDLSSLAKMARHKLNLSGVYPLFRRSAPDLSGAALRVHITLTPGSLPEAHTPGGGDSQDQENCDSQGEEKEGGQGVPSSTAAMSRQSGTPSRHQIKSSMSVEPSQPSEVSMEDTFTVTITVDRAMHLSLKGCPLAERSGGLPSCCVSYVMADSAEPVTTALIADSHCPVWDHQQECRLSKQLLLDPQQSLVFKVWHKGDVERVIGFASVDLSPLLSGFQSVCGWYNITDFNGQCQGQLKVSVSPLKGVQELRGQRQAVCEDGNKDSSALFQTLPLYYHTTATYSSFPSHVSRYTEQKINSTPNHLDRLLPERSSESDRHDEHMDRVRLYHQSLQEGGVGHPTSAAAVDAHPSSSVLFSALRKNLSELDDIQRYFSHKLSIPTFPSQSEQGQLSRLDEHQVSDTDSSQLLLKSTRLVGEVNNLISGLQGHHRMETIPSSPQNSSTTPPVPDDHHLPEGYEAFPQSAPCFHKASGSPQEDLSPVPSPVPCMYQEHSDSQADEEEEEGDKAPASEDDEGGGPREEEEEDGDYEETVVEPRPLNEVTSLTDRTSPWTSLLSDPDLASLESLETPEEHQTLDYSYHPSLTQQEGERERLDLQTDTLQAWSSSEPIDSRLEEREQHVNSEFSHGPDTDEEDTVSDGERTLQTFDNEAALHQETITAALHEQSLLCSGETASRVPGDRDALSEVETSRLLYDTAAFSEDDTEHVVTSDTYQPETFLHKEDNRKSKHSDPVEIPNFFLSSHHMEASMRALRIAPVFPLASSDPKKSSLRHGILCRRVPRPRLNLPPSSMKKEETKRIAKIFASHFKD